MRVAFMGTPEFAVPSLRALYSAGHEIAGVFTQPDRPAGRGHKLVMPPVKEEALRLGLPVYQFEKLRRQEGLDKLREIGPEVCVTAAFGQILSKKLLEVPPLGTVNVHASLLPIHRGSAPINWAIIAGDKKTGVTTMLTDAGIDTGDMLLRRETDILPEETAGELAARLSELGAELLIETLARLSVITPEKQMESQMSYEPMLSRETGEIDWTKSAQSIQNLVRGVNPWPGARSGEMKIWRVRALPGEGEPGVVIASDNKRGLVVASGDGFVEILELQAPAGKRMAARAYLLGKRIPVGERLI